MAETSVRAPVAPILWAVDASPAHGAFVSTPVSQEVAEACWRGGERRGLYSRLEDPARALLRGWGALEPGREADSFETESSPARPGRPLAMRFDVIEVCGGSGRVSEAAVARGLVVGPV
eukprot:6391201-Lingulodinium_polyedra.AAC.1